MKTIMHVLAAADSSANSPGAWAYLVILAATAAGYMGVPFIGTAAIGAAAVFASQGELNITAVLIAAVIGNEIGGLLGYKIGDRWGRRILERPGPALQWRKKTLAKGEAVYQKWGRLAVFFTPALVSGALRMKFGQFAVWNFFAGTVFVLSVGPAAYGAGRVASGHHDLVSVGMLAGGVAVGALCIVLGIRHHRRHRARRSAKADRAKPEPPSDTCVLARRPAAPRDHLRPGPPGTGSAQERS
jgi:membrane-associated protein